MDMQNGEEHTPCSPVLQVLTPKCEVADGDVVLSLGEQIKYEESSDFRESSAILSHIILGPSVVNFDLNVFHVYMCGYEAYEATKRSMADCTIMKSGWATSQVCAGRRCHFVVELHENMSHAGTSSIVEPGRKIMWCAVEKCNAYLIDTVVREKLNYLLQPVWFRRGVGINWFNDAETPLHDQDNICVNVIASNEVELASIFPVEGAQPLCMATTICNALKVSSYIRICTSKSSEKEELLNVLANGLYNFYQAKAHGYHQPNLHEASAETRVPQYNYPASEVHVVGDMCSKFDLIYSNCELHGNVQVNSNGFADVKREIQEGCDGQKVNAGFSHILQTEDHNKLNKSVSEEEEDFPATPKPRIYPGRRLLLECPTCGMTFRSSRNRYQSLVNHIKRRHSYCQKRLLQEAKKKYVVDA